jgi:hypothetical protein
LLDYSLALFDGWLKEYLIFLSASPRPHYCLAVVTLLDQLDPKEYNRERVSVILHDPFLLVPDKLLDLIGGTKANIEFSRMVSKFLMDRERAGFFWVNSQNYADLARFILEFLRDK